MNTQGNTVVATARRKLKYLATINDETLSEDTDPECDIRYIDISNVDSSGHIKDVATYRFEQAPSRARRLVQEGDVIVSTVRTYLQAIAPIQDPPGNLIASTGFAVVRPRSGYDVNYFKYALRESDFLAEVERRSVGVSYPAINVSDLGNIPVHIHSFQEQQTIAAYLDKQIVRLDSLILEQQHLLKLMDEKRCALIADAAMRGLDPDVSLRDSGIPWIGYIPGHWNIWKLAHTATIGNGSTPSRGRIDYWSEVGTPWLNSSVVNMDEAIQADQFVTDVALRECHLPMVKSGSVLVAITGQGQTRGKATVLALDATINQHLAYITPDCERLDPRYLRWAIFAAYEYLRNISDDTGGTKGALTCEDIANFRVPIPPIHEQHAIAVHIATRLKYLAELHQTVEHVMNLIKERRSALIAAAVTGQIEIERAA